MILESFQVSSLRRARLDQLMTDHEPTLLHRLRRSARWRHWQRYPHRVEYVFNGRGYRDQDWPDDARSLENSTWCIGDSTTMGVGAPLQHTWPWLLEEATGKHTINVSMSASANTWMARKIHELLTQVRPRRIAVCWTFLHRREHNEEWAQNQLWQKHYANIADAGWPPAPDWQDRHQLPTEIMQELQKQHHWPPFGAGDLDEARLRDDANTDPREDLDMFLDILADIERRRGDTEIAHVFVPGFCRRQDLGAISQKFLRLTGLYLNEIHQIDWARDLQHWDRETSLTVVKKLRQQHAW